MRTITATRKPLIHVKVGQIGALLSIEEARHLRQELNDALDDVTQRAAASIREECCGYFNVSDGELCGTQRTARICTARLAAAWFLIAVGFSRKSAAVALQRFHDSTITHSVQRINDQVDTNPTFRRQIRCLLRSLEKRGLRFDKSARNRLLNP